MARLRSLLTLLVAVAMTSALLAGAAWAAGATPTPTVGPAATGAAQPGTSPSATGTSSGNATFGIQPATAKGVDSRDSFAYAATGGSIKTDYVAITNYSTTPLQLHVYATDAYNTADGGFTVLPSTTKPTDLGLWITLAQTFINIPAKSTAIMPFVLRVPMNAAPGDHTGGIVVSLTTMTHDSKGNQVAVESRVGSRVSVRVPGALRAKLAVSDVSAVYHGTLNPFGNGSATVSYVVTNTGNVRLIGTQAVRLTSLFGGSEQSSPIAAIKELLPGDSMKVTTQISGVSPSFTATVRITVTPAGYPGDLDPPFSSVEQTATMIAIPWPLIVLILLIAAGVFVLWRRRRLSRAAGGAGGGPGGGKPKTPGSGGPARPGVKTTAPRPTVNGTKVNPPKVNVPKVTVPAPKPKITAAKASPAKANTKPARP